MFKLFPNISIALEEIGIIKINITMELTLCVSMF